MKGLKESYGSSLKTKAFAAGLMGLGAVSACDSVDADFSTQSAALTSFPGEVGETLNGNCVEYSIVPGEPEKDILCRQHPGLTTGIIVTVRNALAREGAVQIEPIQGTEQWVLPVIHNNRLYGGIKNQNGLYDLVSAEYNADGTISDTKMEFASAMGYAISFQSIDGDLIINRGNNDVRKYKKGLTDGDPWLQVALNGVPAGLKLSSIQPYIGDPNKKANTILVFQNEANGKSYAFEGKYDASTMVLEVIGGAFKTPNMNEFGVTNHVTVVNDDGCVNVVELYGGLVKTVFGGPLCDPKISDKDATDDTISDADVIEDTTGTEDLGPKLDVDASVDGGDIGPVWDIEETGGVDIIGIDGETEDAEGGDLISLDGKIEDAIGGDLVGADGETEDAAGGDLIGLDSSEYDVMSDMSEVTVNDFCQTIKAKITQGDCTLKSEGTSCRVLMGASRNECAAVFQDGDNLNDVVFNPREAAKDGNVTVVGFMSDGKLPATDRWVLASQLSNPGDQLSINDAQLAIAKLPGTGFVYLTKPAGTPNMQGVSITTGVNGKDRTISSISGGETGVVVYVTCANHSIPPNLKIELGPGESRTNFPVCDDLGVVEPPVKEPSSGGGCEAGGEGNHSNGVGAVGAVLIASLLAAYNRRRKQLFGGANDNKNRKVA